MQDTPPPDSPLVALIKEARTKAPRRVAAAPASSALRATASIGRWEVNWKSIGGSDKSCLCSQPEDLLKAVMVALTEAGTGDVIVRKRKRLKFAAAAPSQRALDSQRDTEQNARPT